MMGSKEENNIKKITVKRGKNENWTVKGKKKYSTILSHEK